MRWTENDLKKIVSANPALQSSFPELQKKKNKYHNVKVYEYSNGYVSVGEKVAAYGTPNTIYDSLKEYNRWCELQIMQKAKQIKDLRRQVVFVVQKGGTYHGEKVRDIVYKADHVYVNAAGQKIVEDVKGVDPKTHQIRTTQEFRLKWKMLKLTYPDYQFQIF